MAIQRRGLRTVRMGAAGVFFGVGLLLGLVLDSLYVSMVINVTDGSIQQHVAQQMPQYPETKKAVASTGRYDHYEYRPPTSNYSSFLCHSHDLTEESAKHASCLIKNLCFAQKSDVGKNVGDDLRLDWFFLVRDEKTAAPPPNFTVGIGPHTVDDRVMVLPQSITPNDLQARYGPVRRVEGPSVIFHEYNSENFGHVLTDLALPIFALQESFGRVDRDVQLFKFWPNETIGYTCEHQAKMQGGRESANGQTFLRRCQHFEEMLLPMITQHPVHRLDEFNGTVCFDHVLVGMAMLSDGCYDFGPRRTDGFTLCNHGRHPQFWRFRTYTKANLGVEDVLPTRQKVVIWKRSSKRRGLNDVDGLAEKIREAHKVEVVVVDFAKLSIQEQLKLIGETTVHISPPGGGSFISIYLPRGATTIRLYSIELYLEWNFFHYLGYIHVEHVDCPGGNISQPDVIAMVGEAFERYNEFGSGPPLETQPNRFIEPTR